MIVDLIRAAIRACDAATRAYEAMADHYDEVTPAIVANHPATHRIEGNNRTWKS